LNPVGDLVADVETFSPEGGSCRRIPVGSVLSGLVGTNDADLGAGVMDDWTFQWWMDWTGYPTIPGSAGFSAVVADFQDPATDSGFSITLHGAAGPGAHEWYFSVLNRGGGGASGTPFWVYRLDGPLDWTLFTVVVERLAVFPHSLRLYVNDSLVDTGMAGPPALTEMPGAGIPFYYGSESLQNRISRCRFIPNKAMDASEVAESYLQCIELPPPIPLIWKMRIAIDGVSFAERTISPTERRQWTDFLAPCRNLSGPHEVSFQIGIGISPMFGGM
jgi:hypothetical protein